MIKKNGCRPSSNPFIRDFFPMFFATRPLGVDFRNGKHPFYVHGYELKMNRSKAKSSFLKQPLLWHRLHFHPCHLWLQETIFEPYPHPPASHRRLDLPIGQREDREDTVENHQFCIISYHLFLFLHCLNSFYRKTMTILHSKSLLRSTSSTSKSPPPTFRLLHFHLFLHYLLFLWLALVTIVIALRCLRGQNKIERDLSLLHLCFGALKRSVLIKY